jgi:amidase
MSIFSMDAMKRLTVLYQLHLKMRAMKVVFADAWQGTIKATFTGHPIDALVCLVAYLTGIPHDFDIY